MIGADDDGNNATISRNRPGNIAKNTTIIMNCRGRQRGNTSTATNRMHTEQQYRTNTVSGGMRGAAITTQQSTKVEIMLLFVFVYY